MIYDCFLFNNELDILDIRLHELDKVVDKFVLVESTITHSCKPKRLYFKENQHLFKEFAHKIIHVIVDDTPNVSLPWIVNDYQFSQMKRGLKKCRPTDIILFGDLDEIPRADAIRTWKNKKGQLKIFEQILGHYFLNFMDLHRPWLGTRMTTYKHLKSYPSLWIAKYSKFDTAIPRGGWHLSYMGNISYIQKKLASMTHQEYNNDRYNTKENIAKAILQGKDFIGFGHSFEVVDDNYLPKYIVQNKNKFKKLIISKFEIPSFYIKSQVFLLNISQVLRIKVFRKIKKLLLNI